MITIGIEENSGHVFQRSLQVAWYPVLGLVFLKYVSDVFEVQADVIRARAADPQSDKYIDDPALREELVADWIKDKSFYEEDNVFWIPEDARYPKLLAQAKQPGIAHKLDAAMSAIEVENPKLRGVLYRDFGRLELDAGKIGDLLAIVAKMQFNPQEHTSRDVFGEVYEYFLGNFALEEGQKAGQFYTPRPVVQTLVEVLAPFEGRIYDPCCGSGGMFVYSERFIEAHGGRKGQAAIYGQEMTATTRKLACMNLAIRGLDYDMGREYADTFGNDQHPDLRADFILANPPFNMEWNPKAIAKDSRWAYGTPPAKNANYAWLQHILSKLSVNGRAGVVLANGSMSSNQSGEGTIREAMLKGDVVECMVALPGQLFTNTQIPACLWFLAKNKAAGKSGRIDRRGQVLFIDARKLGEVQLSRTQIALSDAEIQRIAQAYHAWRGTRWAQSSYTDVQGFCKSASLEKIDKHGYVLTPGRYVGAETVEDDDEAFAEKMERLTAQLAAQMAKGAELEAVIREKLGGMGYAV
ncbi:putative type I restriction enzymeP M protein [mine drainage metagenome]|uniref:site-specific DNA-methyltransferase (adenine-specific) n=1 Tax=mine drainage metagenome TaxID=410659 RepID=A0A1J5RC36_9ZZZZ